ncbi:FAS1 domain-containing protein [Plectosphaerella plurivora]|uniref:FAS1 domain-containing protein n=1 Tax=Plectosphaerella plurivora TaxID=936078 RepID=A0A9P9AA40_9PEZI|nr:FAS1 domain-containing protein [Plectosphaerella plurivora]
MRLVTLAVAATASIAAAQLIHNPDLAQAQSRARPRVRSGSDQQKPLHLIPAMPGGGPGEGAVRLSDVLSRDQSINTFVSFVLDIEPVSRRLEDEAQNTTVLAPLNSAIEALPRKPWEDPRDYNKVGSNAYDGDDGHERANRNLKKFVEAHLVPESPWGKGDKVKPMGDDREVWWEERDGTRFIQPGDIEVISVGKTVANGEIWVIKSVRNYA